MNKSKTKKKNTFDPKKISILTLLVIFCSSVLYVYSYQVSVTNALEVQSLGDKMANVKSEISEIELEIVEAKRSLEKEDALSQGFVELEDLVFVKKTVQTALNAVTN